jgi:hypothetical protein
MKVILAIDPGASGGMAVSAFGKISCHALPPTEGDRLELIRGFKQAADVEQVECECVLEQVGGFAGKRQPGSAMFKFGAGYGFLVGVVQALGIKLELVRPQVWQKAFGLGTAAGCARKSEWKNKLKAEAQRRFPQLPVTLATADALLILEWRLSQARSAERGGASRTGDGTNGTDSTKENSQSAIADSQAHGSAAAREDSRPT